MVIIHELHLPISFLLFFPSNCGCKAPGQCYIGGGFWFVLLLVLASGGETILCERVSFALLDQISVSWGKKIVPENTTYDQTTEYPAANSPLTKRQINSIRCQTLEEKDAFFFA